jgi:hypothetical protein
LLSLLPVILLFLIIIEKLPHQLISINGKAFDWESPSLSNISLCDYSSEFAPRIYYFELKILADLVAAIGLVSKSPSMRRYMIGWKDKSYDLYSVGYHSDDGTIRQNQGYVGQKFPQLECTINDTMGVCIDYEQNVVFFTRNGVRITEREEKPPENMKLFAAVSFEKQDPVVAHETPGVKLNLGSHPFVWDFSKYVEEARTAKKLDIKALVAKFESL